MKSILYKLILGDKYATIDRNMSPSNIGGRRNRNVRDHIFVINDIMQEAKEVKKHDINIKIYDIKKCFNKLWYEEQ